jgi:hypothetical protein
MKVPVAEIIRHPSPPFHVRRDHRRRIVTPRRGEAVGIRERGFQRAVFGVPRLDGVEPRGEIAVERVRERLRKVWRISTGPPQRIEVSRRRFADGDVVAEREESAREPHVEVEERGLEFSGAALRIAGRDETIAIRAQRFCGVVVRIEPVNGGGIEHLQRRLDARARRAFRHPRGREIAALVERAHVEPDDARNARAGLRGRQAIELHVGIHAKPEGGSRPEQSGRDDEQENGGRGGELGSAHGASPEQSVCREQDQRIRPEFR